MEVRWRLLLFPLFCNTQRESMQLLGATFASHHRRVAEGEGEVEVVEVVQQQESPDRRRRPGQGTVRRMN